MARILELHLTPKERVQKPATAEHLKQFKEAFEKVLKQNPQAKYKGPFVDKDGVGVCDWETPNAQAVERICKGLSLPYDTIVQVEELKM